MNGENEMFYAVNLNNAGEVAEIVEFLQRYGLTFDAGAVEYTLAVHRNGALVATGSLAGEVLRNVAVDRETQGTGMTAFVITQLMQEAARRGHYHYFIFTKPEIAHVFRPYGFAEIARTANVSLLEAGLGSVAGYTDALKKAVKDLPPGPRAAVVVNCNPFTLGDKALVAEAASRNAQVVVLVVEEERSFLPLDVRLELTRTGLAEYPNVLVVPSGKYIVPYATFPDYFLGGKDKTMAWAGVEAAVFAKYVAPALGVTSRYAGEDKDCSVTTVYNKALQELLPASGVKVIVVPAVLADGAPVCAARVRELILRDDWRQVRKMVPDTTYDFLRSREAAPFIAKVREISLIE